LDDDRQNFLATETAVPDARKVQVNAGIRVLGAPDAQRGSAELNKCQARRLAVMAFHPSG
jgi:hypothetical protein